jgi:flagellar motor switch protein FliM
MDLKLGAVFLIRRGMGEGQGLIVGDRKIYLSEIGEKGDRIQLRVESISLGKYLLSVIWKYH